jgi:preprotein translocase subunit SecG
LVVNEWNSVFPISGGSCRHPTDFHHRQSSKRRLALPRPGFGMQTVVIVVHLMIVLGLIGLVLLQRSEGGGLGMGGGGGFMTTRGSTNMLTRTTAVLAGLFFATSLILSILAGIDRKPTSILNSGAPAGAPSAPGSPPLGSGSGGVLDQLRQQPAQPPAGPQVPRSQ